MMSYEHFEFALRAMKDIGMGVAVYEDLFHTPFQRASASQ
jgi:hypothetical protein